MVIARLEKSKVSDCSVGDFTSVGDDGENKFTSGGLFYKKQAPVVYPYCIYIKYL